MQGVPAPGITTTLLRQAGLVKCSAGKTFEKCEG